MSEKYDLERVREEIENDGLSYCIQCKFGPEYIEDQELAILWVEAKKLLDSIDKKVGLR